MCAGAILIAAMSKPNGGVKTCSMKCLVVGGKDFEAMRACEATKASSVREAIQRAAVRSQWGEMRIAEHMRVLSELRMVAMKGRMSEGFECWSPLMR